MKGKIGVVLCLTVLLLLTAAACGQKDAAKDTAVVVKDVMLANEEGTYTKAQIMLPSDYEKRKVPMVTVSHGFRGNMNSAGAENLSRCLAENGIAAIRMDFSHYVSEDPNSDQTSQYTVDTMVSDQVLCADYMVRHFNADPDRIGVYGRSLGGRSAMTAVNEKAGGYDYKALVLVAPAGNEDALQHYMGGAQKWDNMKAKAAAEDSVVHQGVVLTSDFFRSIEDYVPSEHGDRFCGPVLVFYNTEDYVVLPRASMECAQAYRDCRVIEVKSEKSPHGLEMGFEESEIKDMIVDEIVKFYQEALK